MPSHRGEKRSLKEIVDQEDSADEDYDDRAQGPQRPRLSRSKQQGAPARKKQRRGYRGSDVDSDGGELLSDDESSFDDNDDEEDEIETNERGRPVRKSAKKEVKYEEEDTDQDELSKSSSDELHTPPGRRATRKLIVTLKTGNTPVRQTRNLRNGSYGSKQPVNSSAPPPGVTRRSRRLSHDDDEPIVALTNSGHMEIVRAGSRDPEDLPPRATRGGKGLKYPSKSTIDEESQSVPQAEQAEEEEVEAELEIMATQQDLLEIDPLAEVDDGGDELPEIVTGILEAAGAEIDGDDVAATQAVLEDEDMEQEIAPEEDEDEDDVVPRRGRLTRGASKRQLDSPEFKPEASPKRRRENPRRGAQEAASTSRRRRGHDESSDFDPDQEKADQEDMSSSSESNVSPPRKQDDYESSNNGRRTTRLRSKAASRQRSEASDQLEELAAEVADLKRDEKKKRQARDEIVFEPRGRRAGKKPNYDLLRNLIPIEDEEEAAPSPSQRPRKPGAGSWQRTLFNTYGPFGGGGGAPVLGDGPFGARAQGGVDSDSSDDEVMKQPKAVGGTIGMTPTTTGAFNLFPQTHNADPAQAAAGTPANLGKLKDKQALADADPLGVDQNVNFDSVGGLQGHIDQLKEMVALPLLYPEIFMRFKITPPRGVLFHGPPGTGKTLLARALATSVSSQGRKVTFYMRKGADALSKWVGEAERQLRLLFEEARKTQPSIIFFDEIDGLAPVRSSKQEQIHASIVSTLLALMDGMDGRGQVVVIGATNRPDSIDPALRRPGRFDREFYFPLPDTTARRAIIDIHTKGWEPPLALQVKEELAELTKGYGGADLRALCTEAALNAVQRRYPQIYSSTEKLLIDPKTIEVTPKDFMISIKKMTPSSERSTSSGASPLPSAVAPLLRKQLDQIELLLADMLPQKKRLTALEEAQYEDAADGHSFGREKMQQAFESARVFRPRLLIQGKVGMGQQYFAGALLNHFEGLHVQAFDLPTLLSDTTSSPESTVIRLFAEVKMHKPSVIYIPNVQEWYNMVGQTVLSTFLGLLRSIKPTDPVLLLGFVEGDQEDLDGDMTRELFGYSKKNQFRLKEPAHAERFEFFSGLKNLIQTAPDDFPDPENRKKRALERLELAPPEPPKPPTPLTKEELKAQKRRDRQTLNMLKIRLQPIMDQIRTRHKKFRTGVIDEGQIRYLYDEADPGTVTSDLHTEFLARASFRPFEIGKDAHGVLGLVDQANGTFYYNLDSVTIEKRLSNGYYKRPKDFLADIKRLAKDAKAIGDEDRLLKANELLANVEVDIGAIDFGEAGFSAECDRVYQRELAREKEVLEKAKAASEQTTNMPPPQIVSNVPHGNSGPSTLTNSTGPILLGEPVQRRRDFVQRFAATADGETLSASVVTNGIHPSNEEFGPGESSNGPNLNQGGQQDAEGDTQMAGVDSQPPSHEKSHETERTHTTSSLDNRESAQPRPFHSYTAPSQHLMKESGMSAPRSQTGPFTPMPHGSHPAEFQNDASTTQSTNEKKISSGEVDEGNQQDSGPNLFLLEERRSAGGSQIPSTQGTRSPLQGGSFPRSLSVLKTSEIFRLISEPEQVQFSQDSPIGLSSQLAGPIQPSSSQGPGEGLELEPEASLPPPVPAFEAQPPSHHPNGETASQEVADPTTPAEPRPNLVQVELHHVEHLHTEITDKTSGLSVEQLEQVNSVLMDTLWKTRGEWDRGRVLEELSEAFNEVMADMAESGQDFAPASWGGKTQV